MSEWDTNLIFIVWSLIIYLICMVTYYSSYIYCQLCGQNQNIIYLIFIVWSEKEPEVCLGWLQPLCLPSLAVTVCLRILCFYRTQVSWSDLCVWLSETEWVSHLRLWNFTDVTPAVEDTNWILTDNDKTLPEAQRTQGIDSVTWVTSPAWN